MADTGWKDFGTWESEPDGGPAWQNPSNAETSNDQYASSGPNKTSEGDFLNGDNVASMGVPSGATINGIELSIERYANAVDVIQDYVLQLRKSSGRVGDNKASASYWPISEASATYGGATDLFGTTWTEEEVNSADFGVSLQIYNAHESQTKIGYVDHIKVKVYYTEAGGAEVSKINGVNLSSISKINGINKSSISKFNGKILQ